MGSKSSERLYHDMIKPIAPKKGAGYSDICEKCDQPFTFTSKDVSKENVFKCPFCGHDMIFFASNYN